MSDIQLRIWTGYGYGILEKGDFLEHLFVLQTMAGPAVACHLQIIEIPSNDTGRIIPSQSNQAFTVPQQQAERVCTRNRCGEHRAQDTNRHDDADKWQSDRS